MYVAIERGIVAAQFAADEFVGAIERHTEGGTEVGTARGTMVNMAALNVIFDDREMEAIRDTAEQEGVAMKTLVHDATLNELHRRKVDAAIARVTTQLAEVNRRLANK